LKREVFEIKRAVVVIESHGLLQARLEASLAGADRELEFVSGHRLDQESAGQIPANMIGRFLDDDDLRKLHRMVVKNKPLRHRRDGRQSRSARSGNDDPP
jgi:hypothetical protein